MTRPQDETVALMFDQLSPDMKDVYGERAGIREFEGALARPYAEAIAMLDVLDRYPEALSSVTVFQVDIDDEPHWLVTTSQEHARVHIAKVGGTERRGADVAFVIDENFGGLAEITAVA